MGEVVALNQESVSLRIRLLDDTDGTPATGVVAATAGHEIWYQRDLDNAPVTDGGSAADHAAIGDAWDDWEFIHIREGWYRVDYPNAAFLEGAGSVICGMNATGFTGISKEVAIDPGLRFQGQASGGVTATTTTFPAGTDPRVGDYILPVSGTGAPENSARLILSVSGEQATHLAWDDVNISATTTTIVLIAGDATDALAGINNDVLLSSRSTVTVAQVNTQADLALTDYDLKALLPAALSGDGLMEVNIVRVNDIVVTGVGSAGDPWGP